MICQNLIMKYGVHSSLHPNCHHKIIFSKFNLKIHYHLWTWIWHYDQANVDHIRKAVGLFSLRNTLKNLKINDIIFSFSKIVKNVLLIYSSWNSCEQLIREKWNVKRYVIETKTPKHLTKLNVSKTNWIQ